MQEVHILYPGPPEFITEDQSTELFHVFMTLIVLPTPSLHIEMATYCTIIERDKLHISILVLK